MSLADAASENVRIQALACDNVDFQSERAERENAAAARLARTAEDTLAAIRQMFRWACKRQPWHSMLVDGNLADLVELRHFVPQGYAKIIGTARCARRESASYRMSSQPWRQSRKQRPIDEHRSGRYCAKRG